MATDLLAIDMNFGKDDAESDERLKDWFLETSDFKNVMQLEYSLILGQKGSGKSAILRMLHERAENDTVIIDESVGKVDFLRYFNQIQDFNMVVPVSYTHLRAHETRHDLVCRLLLEKKKK